VQVICYTIVGVMLLFTCQALAELAVLYPVNGAFYSYVVRFVDPSWQVPLRHPLRSISPFAKQQFVTGVLP
jgi:amino acid permease